MATVREELLGRPQGSPLRAGGVIGLFFFIFFLTFRRKCYHISSGCLLKSPSSAKLRFDMFLEEKRRR